MPPTLHLHVGPHFTGGESINHYFTSVGGRNEHFHPVSSGMLKKVASHLTRDNIPGALTILGSLRDSLVQLREPAALASCEDLCGEVPSALRRRKAYSNLFENLQLISGALKPVNCVFYFFTRDRILWARDVYVHHLNESRRYSSFERFCENNRIDELWDLVLRKCRSRFGASFVEVDLEEGTECSPLGKFLSLAVGVMPAVSKERWRAETSSTVVKRLELLNRSYGSNLAVSRAKYSEFGVGLEPSLDEPSAGLEGLAERTQARMREQAVSWLIPELHFPLGDLWEKEIPEEDAFFPNVTRITMEGQSRILRFRMRGLPEPCFLLGMLISYLRRDTVFTDKARDLFHLMWESEYINLLATLPTRWIISSLQTFLDHGRSEHQKIIGASGYFLANMMRAYEAERAFDGMEVDRTYAHTIPKVEKFGGVGLDRFNLGRTDLLLNTASMLYEVSLLDAVAGRVVREFLLRVRGGHTVFSRMDWSRIAHNIDPQGFLDCWSFYRDPRDTDQ